jgi:hypothetical protein
MSQHRGYLTHWNGCLSDGCPPALPPLAGAHRKVAKRVAKKPGEKIQSMFLRIGPGQL